MAGRLRGLSISLDMDSSKVDRSLSQVRRSFRDFNSSLKTNMNNFKHTEKSIGSYKSVIEDLNNTIKGQKKNVASLEAEWDKLTDAEKQNSIRGSQISREYNKQADALNMYEAEMADFTEELKRMENAQQQANSKWGQLSSNLDKTGGKLTSFGNTMKSVGTKLTLGVTTPTVGLGLAAVKAAGDYDAASSQFKQVFGSMEKEASNKLNSIAKQTGLLPNSLKGTYTMMAAFAKTTGADTKTALDITSRATTAAADSAAFYDRSIGDVSESLQSYLKGNFENDAALGISSTETTRNAAANKLYKKSFADLSEEQKQLTLLKMVEDGNKLSGALGQAARESDQFGTQLGNLKTASKDFLAAIGKPILPVAIKLMKGLSKATKSVSTWFSKLNPVAKNVLLVIAAMAAAIGPLITVAGILAGSLGAIMTAIAPLAAGIAEAGSVVGFLATKFPILASAIGLVSWPVVGIVAALAGLTAGFVIAYKKSQTFRNIVNGAVNGVKNAIKKAMTVVKGFFQLFKGNGDKGALTLSKILPPGVVEGLKTFASNVKKTFSEAIGGIVSFAKSIGNKLKTFWDENGTVIMQALTNIGNIIKMTFNNVILPVIRIAMKAIWAVMKVVWPLIKFLIVDTWNNIKGIISGALDIIMGVIKIFAGLFTGNWGKMWEGIKQVLKGAVKLIWNLIQLYFIGKVLKVVKLFGKLFGGVIKKAFNGAKGLIGKVVKSIFRTVKNWFGKVGSSTKKIFKSLKDFIDKTWTNIKKGIFNKVKSIQKNVKNRFTGVWNDTKKIFKRLKDWLNNIWKSIKTSISNKVKDIKDAVKNRFTGLWNDTRKIFKRLKNWLKNLLSDIKKDFKDKVQAIKDGVKNKFTGVWNDTKRIFSRLKNWMSNTWKSIKEKIVDIASVIKNKVTGTFGKMKDSLKNIIDKIGGFIGGMVKKVKEGLNKLIDGVNWVGKKLNMDALPKIKLHTGTEHTNTTKNVVKNGKIAKDTFATVGDKGRGNGPGGFRHEMIKYPNGSMALTPNRDTTAYLPKGSAVMNGAQTHSMLSSNPEFSNGTLPKFSNGTGWNLLGGGKKGEKHNHDDGLFGDVVDDGKAIAGKVVNGGKALVSKTLETAGKGKDWLKDKIGDVMDWISKPGKLMNKVLEGFGVSMKGFGIDKAASLPHDMMSGMFGKLKKATTDLFKSWMEEQAGDGDGGYIDLSKGINFGYAETAADAMRMGYPFPMAHHGLDINYKHDPVYSTLNGTAVGTPGGWNGGFGNMMKITSGNLTAIYGHLSKLAFTGSKKVKPGDKLGISGGALTDPGHGMSSGEHLHYEMHRDGKPFDPTSWLKEHNGSGKSKKASAWAGDIRRAAKKMKVNLKGNDLNNIISLINAESSGNPGAVQSGVDDVNSRNGNPAQGLLQYIPQTFRNYAMKGHGNIKSGYDQLLAFFNNQSWRSQFNPNGGWSPSGARRFATGGKINNSGWYNLAEGGYPEWVIPTDPARSSEAMSMINMAANEIDSGSTSGNVRPHNMNFGKSNGSPQGNEMLEAIISNQNTQIDRLQEMVEKLTILVTDTRVIKDQPKGFTSDQINKAQGSDLVLGAYNVGGVF